ncbi:hypothetical protein [Azonexus sp.]|uniref:hypothetical protein n=1 Tax=Azonexus sp. TaxID=1872668 RepID=UPI0028354A0A|nr:hypothetical protein [Azonexus sp.]MDR1995588.1 hypothetical protein [Azonexus sp.]
MADIEQPLLQAVRDLPQPEPGPALDAAILSAAAKRAEEVRKARTVATEVPATILKVPKTRSTLERFSRWLFGDGQTRGHFKQAVAASIIAGIALGIVWQADRENASALPEVAMMEPAPAPTPSPAPSAITQGEALKERLARKAMPPAEKKPAAASATADSIAADTKADKVQLAVASPALPPPAAARGQDRAAEAEPSPAAVSVPAQVAALAPQTEEVAERRVGGVGAAAIAPLAKAVAPSPAQDAAKGQEINAEAEIEAQLKRILDLHHAGKEEEAQRLLSQLRVRYPGGNIDERLRQREKEESK